MTSLIKLRCNEKTFTLGTALFFALVSNGIFIIHAWKVILFRNLHDYLFAATVPLVLFCAFIIIVSVLSLPWLRKPLLVLLLLASAAANYFMFSFGAVIDANMMQNVFETNMQEAASLFSYRYLLWMLIMGIIPALIVSLVNIAHPQKWLFRLVSRALYTVCAISVALLIAACFYKDYASMIRNNRGLVKMITPVNVVSGTGHYINTRWLAGDQALIPIGLDAKKGALAVAEKKKTLVIFVLGETGRAENFSLGGYSRETNPQLKEQGVIYYKNATSCGTETAVSVPCMFSNMSRNDYNANLALHQEGVLDILSHAGINVLWRENDSGCKGACDRIPHTDMTQWQANAFCQKGYCQDGMLLYRLPEYIDSVKQDTLIVLHQMGSHGPAYYLRYPPDMRKFTPTCDTNQIQDCTPQALVNTYDNSLLYTDSMLSDTIKMLKAYSDRFNVALVYLSDHGESLGEHGIYLHGTPYVFAPSQQTHIPFLFWMSPDYARTYRVNTACLRQKAEHDNVSQDNLFHTLLGMLNVETKEYQPGLDMMKTCQS
nr:phosphoethanolamine transferase EptA [Pantoea sp. 201603H]